MKDARFHRSELAFSLALSILLSSCSQEKANIALQYPVISIDEAHSGLEQDDGKDPKEYKVPPSPGVIVDCSDYEIDISPKFKVEGPNMIHLIMGENRMYRTRWRGREHLHVLDDTTLEAQRGSLEFRGFNGGETFIIAVGFDHTGITPGKENVLSTMWMGIGRVE